MKTYNFDFMPLFNWIGGAAIICSLIRQDGFLFIMGCAVLLLLTTQVKEVKEVKTKRGAKKNGC